MAARKTTRKAAPRKAVPRKAAPRKAAPARNAVAAPTAAEVPVTYAMLREVRTELLERIDQAKAELRSDMQRMEARLDAKIDAQGISLRSEMAELRAEVKEVKADLTALRGEVHGMRAELARVASMVEEQNARNRIVLDGLMAYIDRQNRLEKRMDDVEETVRKLAAA
jgi:chromosome segregation ATPase